MPILDESPQTPLAHHRVTESKPCEFCLTRTVFQSDLVEEPLVEWSVIRELKTTKRMSHPFDGISLTMSPVVCGIDAPVISGSVMSRSQDPVHHWISHDDVR